MRTVGATTPTMPSMQPAHRFRVEDLAAHTELSVDTIRFYQKRALLHPPTREGRVAWYDDSHVARIERIRNLQHEGYSLTLIGRILDVDPTDTPLAAAVLQEHDTKDDAPIPRAEFARIVGVPSAVVDAIIHEGLLAPRVVRDNDGTVSETFSATDVELVRMGVRLIQAGLPLSDVLALARKHNAMIHAIAEEAVEMFDLNVRQPLRNAPADNDNRAAQIAEAFRLLLPTVSDLVADHFRRVLLDIVRTRLDLDDATLEEPVGATA
jgi:DNA-binding transcriptional MerR regulator